MRIQRLRIKARSLICNADVVGERLDFRWAQVELGHAPDQSGTQCVGILEKIFQPCALYRAAFPCEVWRHITAVAIDGVAAQAAEVVYELAGIAARMIVRGERAADDQLFWISYRAVCLRQQGRGKRVSLRVSQRELRHLQARTKRPWIVDLGGDIVRQIVFHARSKDHLRQRPAADLG